MLRMICCAGLCASLPYLADNSLAATVFRCEDSQGRLTYTHLGCPDDNSQSLQRAYNPTPGTGKATPMARDAPQALKDTQPREVVVVGRKLDGCGDRLTSSERRQAIIRQQIRGGMTRSDVESAFGKPDKITRVDGDTRYHYDDTKGNRRQVTLDEAGCVKEKGKR